MEQEPKPVVTGYPAAAQPPPHPAAATGVPAHGTAYPYQLPPYYPAPPPPPPGPYYQPPYNSYGRSTAFLRRLIIITIAVFLIVGFATFIAWLVLRPRLPVFAVASATVSSFNASVGSQQISAEFNLSVSVRNPNKRVDVAYDELDAAVLYGSTLISETSLAPFDQEKGDSRVLPARFAAVGRFVGGDVTNDIARERSSNGGAIVFHVRFVGLVNFRSGAWRTRRLIRSKLLDWPLRALKPPKVGFCHEQGKRQQTNLAIRRTKMEKRELRKKNKRWERRTGNRRKKESGNIGEGFSA